MGHGNNQTRSAIPQAAWCQLNRGRIRRLLGSLPSDLHVHTLLFPLGVYQSLRRILSLPLLDRQSRSFRGLSELDQWDQLLLGPGRVVRGCQHWRLNDS